MFVDKEILSEERIEHGAILRRVINPVGVPYSVIIRNGKEEFSAPTSDEKRMLKAWHTWGKR